MTDLEHSIRAYAGYDYRDEPHDDRGAHGLDLMLITKGPLGAITCRISTGWMLRPLVLGMVRGDPQKRRKKPGVDGRTADLWPSGSGVTSHSLTKERDYWSEIGPCDVLGVEACWGDTGYVVADEVLWSLIFGGDEAAFAKLDEFYTSWLGPEEQS
jgi:hypothetical protein